MWPAYGFDQWAWSEMNGWHNPEDDPASPTETALLDEIKRLTADLAAERAEVKRLRGFAEYVHQNHMKALSEVDRLRAAGDALAEVVDDWPELVAAWKETRRER